MYETQTYGEMETDPFELNEADGYGFMQAESETGAGANGGLAEYEALVGGSSSDGFDGFDGFDQEAWEGESFDQFEPFDQFDQFGDMEGDPFFGKIWNAAKKAAKVVAPIAKKFAPAIGSVIGGALGGPAGAAIGGKLGGFVKNMEAEDEGETEDELNAPVRVPATDDQLSEAMAAAAARSTPLDASALGSALTVTIASRAPLPVKAVMPVLAKAGSDVARRLATSRDPRAKALIRTLPTIQKKTVATLTRKVQSGRPVTPRTAVRVMARHASRTLSNPQVIAKALADNAAKKRGIDKKAVAAAERFF
ncbi:hypothetical protein SAMN05428950_10140 [Sphingomonas sp. OV641]|uniref:hypothetical protein n=1 Tax=unclassified Sphingomonas TaxID=196159 RepID=UPI000831F576|nr:MULTISPECIES: hypothetical protein [unclassified Sphingomonas]SEI72896.1 hypothetical protein SAMN05428950_10140 [Sphingomonas sp. OV641]